MTTEKSPRIGFMHDYSILLGEATSETDAQSKYAVESSVENLESPEEVAELSVIEFDPNQDLEASGFNIKNVNTGPLKDFHDNYRSHLEATDFGRGVARFGVKDYVDVNEFKSKDELWSQYRFQEVSGNPAPYGGEAVVSILHWDGEVLMRAEIDWSALTLMDVRVATRNESTKVWGSYIDVDSVAFRYGASFAYINPYPALVTIPGLGTLCFYFALTDDAALNVYTSQVIKASLTRDHGATWEDYTSIALEPFFGKVVDDTQNRSPVVPYAWQNSCVLKATYYNNKIVLGMMLAGSEAGASAADELRLARILNLMVSNDIGKSWITVPYEFLSAAFEGQFPGGTYILGEPAAAYEFAVPFNFGLGFDPRSDKVILAVRSSGLYTASGDKYEDYKNLSNLYFFYNKDDNLLEWEATKVDGVVYKKLDNFDESLLGISWEEFTYSGAAGSAANWEWRSAGWLQQNANTNGSTAAAYTAGQAAGGTHQIYTPKQLDPSLWRTNGIRCKMLASVQETMGIGFCYVDEDNFIAITIDCGNNNVDGTCNMYFSSVVAGAENITGATAFNWSVDTWGTIEILFTGEEDIEVYFDGVLVATYNGAGAPPDVNDFRDGNIILISNNQAGCGFDELGLITGRAHAVVPCTQLNDIYKDDYPSIGSNMDIAVDQYGQCWFAADVSAINLDDGGNYISTGFVLQKLSLERDVERVKGKFLARNLLLAKLGAESTFSPHAGHWLDPLEWSVFYTHLSSAAGTPKVRPYLDGFVWKKDDPVFLIRREDTTSDKYAIIERAEPSNRNMLANINSCWHGFTRNADPPFAGWNNTGSPSTTPDPNIEFTANTYAEQIYGATTGLFNSNAARDTPVQFFDYKKRGMCAAFRARSVAGNADGSTRTLFEAIVPSIAEGNPATATEVRFRVTSTDGSSAQFEVEWADAVPTWTSLGTLGSVLVTAWWEFFVFLLPSDNAQNANDHPEISVYARQEGDTHWQTLIDASNQELDEIPDYATPGNIFSDIKFGAFDGSGGTPNKVEFSFFGYGDTCYMSPAINTSTGLAVFDNSSPIRGESLDSGERIYTTKGIRYTVSGGMSLEGDEWSLIDLTRRAFSKENALKKSSILWQSANDNVDKAIVFDAQHFLEFDSIVLYNTNCPLIRFQANDTDSWGAPTVSFDISMQEVTDEAFTMLNPTNAIFRTAYADMPYWEKDKYRGRILYDTDNDRAYRIITHENQYIVVSASTITGTGANMAILADRVAIKLLTRRRHRFFRLVFISSGINDPTPEGKFQLGQFLVGVYDKFQWNPEYPEVIQTKQNTRAVRNASGIRRKGTNLGKPTRTRTLNFNAIDMNPAGFRDQIVNMWRAVKSRRPVYYVPYIEERAFANSGFNGTYTFDLLASHLPPTIKEEERWGSLKYISLTMEEEP